MEKVLKILFNVSRIILGIVFIFSGFVKGIDLLGSAYKFDEYFHLMGLPEMPQVTIVLSYLLSGAEFLIGVGLLTGVFINLTVWTTVFFMGFFTILTFILAVFNPVSDCGCFGDAVKLTNWETFFKNIIFSLLVAFIFIWRKKFVFKTTLWMEWATVVVTIIIFSIISLYSYKHLPIVDFLPYNVGANITEKMTTPANAPQDEYTTTFEYKNIKTGKIKEFDMNNYPWQDTLNWKWVDTKSKLIKKGYVPPIHDFSITTPSGINITDAILSDTSYTFLLISSNINKANPKGIAEGKSLAINCASTGKYKFYLVTSSVKQDIQKINEKYSFDFNFNTCDETALKTMIRSNPGVILLKDGNIIGKWHYNDIHKIIFKTNNNLLADNIAKLRNSKEQVLTFAIMLGLGLILSLLWAFSMYFAKGNRK